MERCPSLFYWTGRAPRLSPEALFADQNGERRLVVAYAGVPGEASYIEGAIHLPLDQVFAEDGSLKSPAEISAIFGAAGIAEEDPLVIYSDSFFNGFDTFAFWVMKYLGHRELLLLEGTLAVPVGAGIKFECTGRQVEPRSTMPDQATTSNVRAPRSGPK